MRKGQPVLKRSGIVFLSGFVQIQSVGFQDLLFPGSEDFRDFGKDPVAFRTAGAGQQAGRLFGLFTDLIHLEVQLIHISHLATFFCILAR